MEVNNILDWRFQPTYIHCNHLVFIFIQINSSNKLVECLFVLFNTLIFLERVQPIIEVLHVIKRQELLLELLLLLAIATLCLCSTLPPKFYLLSLSGNSSFKVYGHQFNLFFPLGVITIINHPPKGVQPINKLVRIEALIELRKAQFWYCSPTTGALCRTWPLPIWITKRILKLILRVLKTSTTFSWHT